MTTAALVLGGRLRPPSTITTGERMAEARGRISYYASEADRAELEKLAGLRFGGNLTGAIRWAVELAALVASDPGTYGQLDPAAALGAYVKARCEDG